jgi:DNA-binding NarL/FixJ family response regulator
LVDDRIRLPRSGAPTLALAPPCAPGLPHGHEDADFARATLDAGGLGYVVKARLASDLLPAIRAALANWRFISPTLRLDEARVTSPDLPTPTRRKQ